MRQSPIACAVLALALPLCAQEKPPSGVAQKALPEIEIAAETPQQRTPGAITRVEGAALERASSMQDVVRYQPLVSAPGVAVGTSRNRSSFERGGTSGYNIRGVEDNRIGLDVDGIELPDALVRAHAGRAGIGSIGVGRDFIDPEMFSSVQIHSGTTTARRSAGGIGGAVGFRTKSAADYLPAGVDGSAFDGKAGHETANRMWSESLTAAARSGNVDSLLAFSRRDGKQARNHSGTVDAYPDDWHSSALLLKGGWQPAAGHQVQLSADAYRRDNRSAFDGWNSAGSEITETARQKNETGRDALQLQHLWTPTHASAWFQKLDTRLWRQGTRTRDATDLTILSSSALRQHATGHDTTTWGLSSTADQQLGMHRLSFGLSASQEKSARLWQVQDSFTTTPQPQTRVTRAGLFMEAEIVGQAWGRRLALLPGWRMDRVRIAPRNFASQASGALTPEMAQRYYGGARTRTLHSPGLSLAWDVQPALSAWAQYKRSARNPTVGEIFGAWNMSQNMGFERGQPSLLGNRDIEPETAQAWDIGIKGSPAPGLRLNASVFHTRYKKFIGYTRYTPQQRPDLFENVPDYIGIVYHAENRDRATIYGAEISMQMEHGAWHPALRGWHSSVAWGASRGTSISNYAGDKNVPLDSVLPRKAVLGLGWDAPQRRWGVQAIATLVAGKQARETQRNSFNNADGGQLEDAGTSLFRVPGSGVLDVSAWWHFFQNSKSSARLQLALNNLLDKRYWDYASARRLQPAQARDRRDIELLTRPGRSLGVALNVVF